MSDLTHIGPDGRARMVDVSAKPETERVAEARGLVRMEAATLDAIAKGAIAKGEVLRTAELAGIMAAKRAGDLIPMCHPLPLSAASVIAEADPDLPGVRVVARVTTVGRTGVEMEALTAVSVACLTIYDMAKAIDRGMTIERVELVAKSGGKSGDWRRT
ncbi:cyclic pyranopterin monophosphate synthase MoaC [Sphingomonas sp.]|uniref:cyclic pyranopterin monophosphate synthase MoaC n=1 Tax=Sphingomonas sp. TaxID=28214 RepID=UPI00286A739A|nr:cyclic pyranopterin monophosphate synthase MoaC [Sphingomonas sp.]